MKVKRNATGRVLTTNCLNSTGDNAGCGVKGQEASYGKAFNDAGGGVCVPLCLSDGEVVY